MNTDFNHFFEAEPKGINVSEVKPLKVFIRDYPNQQLHQQMYKLQQQFQYYRAIKGDGNCFYRACIFLYLSKTDLSNYNNLFPKAPIFDCYDLPFYNQDNYSSEDLLQFIWKKHLKPMERQSSVERQKKLQKLFNSSEMFDVVMVSYFRSLNHQYIKRNRSKFEGYVNNGIQNQLRKVLTFGQQSQGVQIYSLAQLLGITISIMMTLQSTVKQEKYLQNGRFTFVLFYRPGHYDILVPQYQPADSFKYYNLASKTRTLNSSAIKSSIRNDQTQIVVVNRPEHLARSKVLQTKDISMQSFMKYQSYKNDSIITNNYEQSDLKKRQSVFNRQYSTSTIDRTATSNKFSTPTKLNNQIQPKNIQLKLTSPKKPTVNSTRIIIEISIIVAIISLTVIGLYKF